MNQVTKYQEYPKENREYKSSLFCKIFAEKKDLLDLYNGINGTDYQNEDDLEVNTLENVVYITMKNDISFLIDCDMCLYEHQSTYNPNMPLRGLLYFAQLFNKYVTAHKLNLFSTSLQKIPVPKYVVFYNGKEDQPDEQVMLLSEAFQKDYARQHVDGCLECEALMLNINYGHNRKLMEKCRKLEEYAIFVARVRKYVTENTDNPRGEITRAIDECIAEDILRDILSSQKSEVLELVLTTFDRELYEEGLREEGAQKAAEKIKAAEERAKEAEEKAKAAEKEIAELKKKIAELTKE